MHPCFITEHETTGQINFKEEPCVWLIIIVPLLLASSLKNGLFNEQSKYSGTKV